MRKYNGKSIFNGTAIGRIMLYAKNQQQVLHYKIEDTNAEIVRYEEAKKSAIKQLNALYKKALAEVGETNAMIFEVHIMMLEDEDYNDSIYNIIKNDSVNAEFAAPINPDEIAEAPSAKDIPPVAIATSAQKPAIPPVSAPETPHKTISSPA